MPILNNEILIFSGHYQLTTQYAKLTRKIFEEYTQLHGNEFISSFCLTKSSGHLPVFFTCSIMYNIF